MATITPGTGSTISATTIEGQLFQLIHWINNAEAIAGGDNNKFSLSKDQDGMLLSSFTLDSSFSQLAGLYSAKTLAYLASTPFSAGTALGTIKGTTFAQYFIDAMSYGIVWQRNQTKNPQRITGLSLKLDYTTGLYSGDLSLPYTSVLDSTGVTESAIEWLLT